MFRMTNALFLAALLYAQAPKDLIAPKGQTLLLKVKGTGSQIYSCQRSGGEFKWVLKGPEAKLTGESGDVEGRHFAGPTWQANDGSLVRGRMVASSASPNADSIPWLLVTATEHEGRGIMTGVQSIQRLETKGGKAPDASCEAKDEKRELAIAYEAEYYFWGERAR